jgi:hypothetical protein
VDRELIIRKLIRYGHLQDVTWGELSTLSIHDDRVDGAIASYRWFMGLSESVPLDKAFDIERCGCPDIQPVNADAGSGSWPSGCHPEYPSNHAFAVYFTRSQMPSHWGKAFEEAWRKVRAAYADVGMVFFETSNRAKANTIVTWQRGAGWIGLAIVPRGPRCGQTIWAKYDNRYGSSFSLDQLINQLAHLMAHEFGHNMGLGHTRGGIMNPTLLSSPFTATAWRGTPSFPTLQRYFTGVPVTPDAPIWTIPQPEQP